MDEVLAYAESLGLTVTEQPGAGPGDYDPATMTIRLTPGLSQRVGRSVLMHEIGHHVLGHAPTPFGPIHGRQERAANEWAAARLIDLTAYKAVEIEREGHLAAMAYDLGVTIELVTAYQGVLSRELRKAA